MKDRKMTEFQVRTSARDDLVDITGNVAQIVAQSGVGEGVVTIYCPHTTAGITINENADPDVVTDIVHQLNEMVPWRQPFYRHCEDNSAAHVKSSMVGCSETIPVSGGKMALGTWQGIYFCEFDGPRNRRVIVSTTGQ